MRSIQDRIQSKSEVGPSSLDAACSQPGMVFAVISDVHLSQAPPRSRVRPPIEVFEEKVKQILGYYRTKGWCLTGIIVAGDLLHTPNPPVTLIEQVRRIIEASDTYWVILPGNHDVRYQQISREASPLMLLEGPMSRVPWCAGVYPDMPDFYFSPWSGGGIPELPQDSLFHPKVAVAHAEYSLGGEVLPGSRRLGQELGWLRSRGIKTLVLGHIHQCASVDHLGLEVMCPGPFYRRVVQELDPGSFVWENQWVAAHDTVPGHPGWVELACQEGGDYRAVLRGIPVIDDQDRSVTIDTPAAEFSLTMAEYDSTTLTPLNTLEQVREQVTSVLGGVFEADDLVVERALELWKTISS